MKTTLFIFVVFLGFSNASSAENREMIQSEMVVLKSGPTQKAWFLKTRKKDGKTQYLISFLQNEEFSKETELSEKYWKWLLSEIKNSQQKIIRSQGPTLVSSTCTSKVTFNQKIKSDSKAFTVCETDFNQESNSVATKLYSTLDMSVFHYDQIKR